MAGQGTTGGGAFRYPYERTVLQGLPDDALLALHMDRDRALEDYLSRSKFPWTVVASDGTGDYRTIKKAVEAVTAPEASEGAHVIIVKRSADAYSDASLGRVEIAAGARIIIAAELPHIEDVLQFGEHINRPPAQAWTYDGFTTAGSGTAHVTLIGLNANSGSATPVVPTLANGEAFRLAVQNGSLLGTGQLHAGCNEPVDLAFAFADCYVQPVVIEPTAWVPLVTAYRTRFAAFGSGTMSNSFFSAPFSNDQSWLLSLTECVVPLGALTLSGNGTFALAKARFEGCYLSGSLTFNDPGRVIVSHCTALTALTLNNSSGTGAPDGNQVVNNEFGSVSITGDEILPCRVTGVYSTLSLGGVNSAFNKGGVNADVVLRDTLSITGDQHFVKAVFEASTGVAAFTVNVSGNNNLILYTGSNVTLSNTGSGNSINALPPTGAAGGDLSGSYPNPTVKNLTQLTLFDAKGDLLAATADNTPARLAVGTNGHVLTADSGEATGVKWAEPTAVQTPYFIASGDTFTVATNCQVLFATPIDVEGVLDVIGILIEVT